MNIDTPYADDLDRGLCGSQKVVQKYACDVTCVFLKSKGVVCDTCHGENGVHCCWCPKKPKN